MKNCFCCHKAICSSDVARCSGCGFPIVANFDENDPKQAACIRRSAEEYRKAHTKKVTISVVAINNSDDGSVSKEVEHTVCSFADLDIGETAWCPISFSNRTGFDNVDFVFNENGKRTEHRVTLEHPDAEGFRKIGVKRTDMYRVVFLLGTAQKYNESVPITV